MFIGVITNLIDSVIFPSSKQFFSRNLEPEEQFPSHPAHSLQPEMEVLKVQGMHVLSPNFLRKLQNATMRSVEQESCVGFSKHISSGCSLLATCNLAWGKKKPVKQKFVSFTVSPSSDCADLLSNGEDLALRESERESSFRHWNLNIPISQQAGRIHWGCAHRGPEGN